MLESYFKRDHTLDRLRAEPTGRYMDDFAETLHTKGYGVWAAQAYLRAAAHLGIWIKRKGFSVMKLDEQVIGEFARHLPSCHCLGKNRGIYDDAAIGARHFSWIIYKIPEWRRPVPPLRNHRCQPLSIDLSGGCDSIGEHPSRP